MSGQYGLGRGGGGGNGIHTQEIKHLILQTWAPNFTYTRLFWIPHCVCLCSSRTSSKALFISRLFKGTKLGTRHHVKHHTHTHWHKHTHPDSVLVTSSGLRGNSRTITDCWLCRVTHAGRLWTMTHFYINFQIIIIQKAWIDWMNLIGGRDKLAVKKTGLFRQENRIQRKRKVKRSRVITTRCTGQYMDDEDLVDTRGNVRACLYNHFKNKMITQICFKFRHLPFSHTCDEEQGTSLSVPQKLRLHWRPLKANVWIASEISQHISWEHCWNSYLDRFLFIHDDQTCRTGCRFYPCQVCLSGSDTSLSFVRS